MRSVPADAGPAAPRPWHADPVLRLLVTGSLLNGLAFFATLPFLALYLSDISTLSEAGIGLVVGSVALISAVGGAVGGLLTDRLGGTRLIQAGLLVNVVAYAALGLARELTLIVALVCLLGVGRLLTEPAMKKALSLAATGSGDAGSGEAGSGEAVFRIRYVTLCVAATVGPLGGAALYAVANWMIFLTPAVIFTGYLALVTARASLLRGLDRRPDDDSAGVGGSWRLAVRDRLLLRVVAAGLVLFLVFSQFESILPLYIKSVRGESALTYFSLLLVLNAALAIAMQWPATRLARRLSQPRLALLGALAFVAAALLFRGLEVHPLLLFAGVVFWTMGEAVLFPMPDTVIHTITPDARKGAYFGFAELRYLGFFLGPVAGGALLGVSASLYFGLMAVTILGTWLLLRDQRLHGSRPAVTGAEAPAASGPARREPAEGPEPTGPRIPGRGAACERATEAGTTDERRETNEPAETTKTGGPVRTAET
ncbi:MFS transporter [Streptomyces sp. 3MP-14]|uniref:MFS transporter n=1 Tax=Streptomyces mimosae TaxID=2586635 RepID=A0A5N6A6C9_9ACTN|nr:MULTISPECIES: MFS transporter [Streptomyces]KAB8163782.1 MFS transporter [Streptomyces mimosae]KAB8175225.1 MFS transporter [Streptomyces sp. 3MP-14]